MADTYIPNAGWRDPKGRPDAIDDIADQFERRPAVAATAARPVDLAAYRPATPESDAARLAG